MIRRAAEGMDVNLQVCTDPEEVERLLFCHRYDGLIVDHDETTETILRSLRQSPSSRSAIAIDVHDQDVDLQSVFAMGANFEMISPVTVDRARRTLHLAQGLMMLGRRRYYRHPVQIPAQAWVNERPVDAWVSNVSELGLGLRSENSVLTAGPIRCSFQIPGTTTDIRLDAAVVWADKTGQAGCRIEQITQGRDQYVEWLCRLFHRGPAVLPTHFGSGQNNRMDAERVSRY